jgi:hypothetical protein
VKGNQAVLITMLVIVMSVVLLACYLASGADQGLAGQIPPTIDLWGVAENTPNSFLIPPPISTYALIATIGDMGLMILGLYLRFKDEHPQVRT